MLLQVSLTRPGEPLQVPYPEGFPPGEKSLGPEEETLFFSSTPRFVSPSELALVRDFCKTLPYPQSLVRSGLVLFGGGDPLAARSPEDLDAIEAALGYPNSRTAPGGGQRAPRERAIGIRDRGYIGDGPAIAALLAGGAPDLAHFLD